MKVQCTRSQRGVVLFMTLIMLVAMTLIGLALFRNVDSSTLIANNLGFRQSALVTADLGTELAVVWLNKNKASLISDAETSGYYSTEQTGTDFTGMATSASTDNVDWTGASGFRRACWVKTFNLATGTITCGATAADQYVDGSGNSLSFIVQRMCDATGSYGASSTIQCATEGAAVAAGGSKGAVGYGSYAISSKAMIYYRVTSRVTGPRNSTSYLQTMVLVEY